MAESRGARDSGRQLTFARKTGSDAGFEAEMEQRAAPRRFQRAGNG